MPSSRPESVPPVISLVRQINPASILDVGVGFGKWGHLFREYTDILASEKDPDRYNRSAWRVRLDGIEGHAPYITPIHTFLYNHIYVGNALDILPSLNQYDLVFAGDILEHFDECSGLAFLNLLLDRSCRYVVITTPRHETFQSDLCDNPLERHRSVWDESKLLRVGQGRVYRIPADILLAIYSTGGERIPDFGPSYTWEPRLMRRLRSLLRHVKRSVSSLAPIVRRR